MRHKSHSFKSRSNFFRMSKNRDIFLKFLIVFFISLDFTFFSLGLELALYLDQENYMLNKLTQSSGAKVVVHDPSLAPLLEEYAIDVQPNTATSIGVQTVSSAGDLMCPVNN